MNGIAGYLRLGWDALLLRRDAYERMRDAADPVVKGLVLIVLVGAAIALLAFVGDVLEWATMPDLLEVKDTVRENLMRMPWWEEATAAEPQFRQYFDSGMTLAGTLASPWAGPTSAGHWRPLYSPPWACWSVG
jgi:hypothetical protein